MKKNVASQVIGAQMVSATDGSAFTAATTIYVTGDAGTQAVGSVGAGACTHEGNGFHTYAPAQAETNYTHVAFTFIGTGAVPGTVQVYTEFPQTGDSFALIGATGSGLTSLATQASVTTIDDFLDTEIAAILAAVDTEVATIITNVAAVKVDTAAILVDTGTTLDARIPAALVGGRMDASIGAAEANTLTASALATDAAQEIADTVLARALTETYAADGVAPTLQQALLLIQQMLTEMSIAGTTMTIKKLDGITTAATLTLDDATTPTSVTRAT